MLKKGLFHKQNLKRI